MGILEELENIDDDCDRHGITFVKTQVSEKFEKMCKYLFEIDIRRGCLRSPFLIRTIRWPKIMESPTSLYWCTSRNRCPTCLKVTRLPRIPHEMFVPSEKRIFFLRRWLIGRGRSSPMADHPKDRGSDRTDNQSDAGNVGRGNSISCGIFL